MTREAQSLALYVVMVLGSAGLMILAGASSLAVVIALVVAFVIFVVLLMLA